jgi:uncharacterized membrane protein YhaH (DUF805 family)
MKPRSQAMNFVQVLFSFSGRINRAKYWLGGVFWAVVSIVVFGVLAGMLAKDIMALGSDPSGAEIVRVVFGYGIGLVLVFLVVLVPMIVSSFAIGIKRLHDRDQSGWWLVLFYIGPSAVSAIGQSSGSRMVSLVLSLASFAISIWAIVVLGFLRGTRGPNRYGPDPLGGDTAGVAATSRA